MVSDLLVEEEKEGVKTDKKVRVNDYASQQEDEAEIIDLRQHLNAEDSVCSLQSRKSEVKIIPLSKKKAFRRQKISISRESLSHLTEKKQEQTCVICLEEPTAENLAKLDSCLHIYCYECIRHWVDSSESKCPLCKADIGKITYKDSDGKDA